MAEECETCFASASETPGFVHLWFKTLLESNGIRPSSYSVGIVWETNVSLRRVCYPIHAVIHVAALHTHTLLCLEKPHGNAVMIMRMSGRASGVRELDRASILAAAALLSSGFSISAYCKSERKPMSE